MDRPYTPFDIIWIKHVNDKINGQAYMDEDDVFTLHCPTIKYSELLKPKIDELILLYQKIDNKSAFTHLVTPVDEKIIENEKNIDYKYGRRIKVIAKTNIHDAIQVSQTSWMDLSFQGISQGGICNIRNTKTKKDITFVNFDFLLQDIWNAFTPFFGTKYKNSIFFVELFDNEIDDTGLPSSAVEGRQKLIAHYTRERNRKIIQEKKQQAVKDHKLFCEVCAFSFIDKFGVKFIECHHKTPISQSGETSTNPEDLGLVCANCHRMLHTKIEGRFLTIEELKEKINAKVNGT